jgi:hypothetical protein
MNERVSRLAARIRTELAELNRVVARLRQAWDHRQRTGDDLYLDSVALNLHGFCAGLERLFELIATRVDGQMPQGPNWHQALLLQMSQERPEVRPAVLSDQTRQQIEDYRVFRHVVRNLYTFQFDPDKLRRLVEGSVAALVAAQTELQSFADFLAARSEAENPDAQSP